MKPVKDKKRQQDRLLKRLNTKDRKQQEQIRLLILQDQLFKTV